MSRIHYKNYKGIILLARGMRKQPTYSESILWQVLRDRRFEGCKFLRQHPVFYRIDKEWVEFFIVDFYCSKLKLIIELDGPIHESTKEEDKERDKKLNERGFSVIRIKNEELSDIDKVFSELKHFIYK